MLQAAPVSGGAGAGSESHAAAERLRIFIPHASDTFTDHRAHGDGLVAFEVASRLAARGHDVHVMAPLIDVRGELPPTLHLERLPAAAAAARGMRGRLAYLRAVRSTYARLSRERRFDIVHQLNPVYTGVSLALADARVPVVLGAFVGAWPNDADTPDIMGAIDMPLAKTLRGFVAALQQRLASAMILTTPAAETLIVNPTGARARMFTIPHGIDAANFTGTDLDALGAPEVPTILFLGGTERRKGIYVLLEAFEAVHRAVPQARLLIAGGGGREGEVAAFVEKLAVRSNIDFAGVIERSQIPALMRRMTVLAAPSFGEPFGMALLEAMASSKPVVVTNTGGPAHIVDVGGGFKVPAGDAGALARALLAILQSPDLAAEMGRYNRRSIEATYAWDRVIDRIESVYAHVRAKRTRT